MTKEGYIKLYRQLQDHWLWRERPFSPGQAWVDLVMRVTWQKSTIPHPSKVGPSHLDAGELLCSKRSLSVSWGWSRERVDRFLQTLKNESMIESRNDATYTVIKVLNWNKFQQQTEKTSPLTLPLTLPPPLPVPLPPPLPPSRHIQEGKEGKEEKEREEGGRPPALKSDLAGLLATAYLSQNRGTIAFEKARDLCAFFLNSKGSFQAAEEAIMNKGRGKKLWELLDPIRPTNGFSASWKDIMDKAFGEKR